MSSMLEQLARRQRFPLSEIEDNGLTFSDTSEALAFAIYLSEIEEFERIEQDGIMASRLEETTRNEEDLLEIVRRAELKKMIKSDRAYALELQAGRTASLTPSTSTSSTLSHSTDNSSINDPSSSSSSPVASGSRAPPVKTVECVICNDKIPFTEAIQVPCAHSHYYGVDCLKSLFLGAMKDESLFPPKCDRVEIPISLILPHFTSKEKKKYTAKSLEFSTVNQVYCSNKKCSIFLGKGTESKSSIKCDNCGTSNCGGCKNGAHKASGICSMGKVDEMKENLKRKLGFQECPRCQIMVELESGCYHMTCRCSSQFCYLCAAPWKTCTCPQRGEGRLFRAADVRLEAVEAARVEQNIPVPAVLVPRAERVRRMADELRNNHDW